MALLALIMAPAQAAALLVVPSLVTNLWQARPAATFGPIWRRIAGMQAGACAGTLAGAWWLGAPSGVWAGVCMGVALVLYAAWGLFGSPPSIPTRREGALGLAVGAATGLVTAATGVFVIPAVPYLQALNLGKDGLIQAMGISFSVSTLALAAGLWLNGSYGADAAGASLLMLLPALLGMGLGQCAAGCRRASSSCASWRAWRCWASTRFSRAWLARAIPRGEQGRLPSGRGACVLTPRVAFPRLTRPAALVERTDGDRHLAPARQLLLHRLDLDARLIEGVPAQEQMPWRVLGLRGLDKGTRDLGRHARRAR